MQSVMENKKATRRNVSVFHQIVQWIPQGMIEQCARNEKIAARNLNYTPRTLPLMPGRDLRARRLLTLQPFYKSLASISHPGRVFIRSDFVFLFGRISCPHSVGFELFKRGAFARFADTTSSSFARTHPGVSPQTQGGERPGAGLVALGALRRPRKSWRHPRRQPAGGRIDVGSTSDLQTA